MISISLEPVLKNEYMNFCRDMQDAYGTDERGSVSQQDIPVIPDQEILELLTSADAESWHILNEGEFVGGAIITIVPEKQIHIVDSFFVFPEHRNQGIGACAWKALEEQYPNVRNWKLRIPCLDQRGIHFCVKHCGFDGDGLSLVKGFRKPQPPSNAEISD